MCACLESFCFVSHRVVFMPPLFLYYSPEAAATFPGNARLIIEGVPPMAVDDVDSLSTAALAGSVQGALKEVFKED